MAVGAFSKLMNTSLLDAARWTGWRGKGVAASIGGYAAGQHALNIHEGKLRAYHGDDRYEGQFGRGIDTARTLVTAGAIYAGASSVLGGPLGLKTLIRGGAGVVKGGWGAAKGIRSFGQGYGQAAEAFGKWRTASREVESVIGFGPTIRSRAAFSAYGQAVSSGGRGGALHGAIANAPGNLGPFAKRMWGQARAIPKTIHQTIQEFGAARTATRTAVGAHRALQAGPDKLIGGMRGLGEVGLKRPGLAIYDPTIPARDLALKSMFLSSRASQTSGAMQTAAKTRGGRIYGRGLQMRNRIRQIPGALKHAAQPFNWNPHVTIGAGLGVIGAGAAAGYQHGRTQTHFPMLEAGNISMATPASQRLNYSTIGLTQALHDRRGRRF